MIVLTIQGFGQIKIKTDHENAPISSENFEKLVKEGFYNGLTFHRIIKGFMIQGGCPLGTWTGGPGYHIKGEFRANGVNNKRPHVRGTISMARSGHPDSAGSQFFICDANDPWLVGQDFAFGEVVEGMDVVDKIASVKKGPSDRPLSPVVIDKAEWIEE